jgi:hypothetical protein
MTALFPTQSQIQKRIDSLMTAAILAGGGTVEKPAGWKPTDFLRSLELYTKPQQEKYA